MKAKNLRKKGFTLIELMIVVAIIGILAAIAIPKFADLITKSKESSAKGTLGAVRSAVTIYYSDMEGVFPSNVFTGLTTGGKYLPYVGGAASLGRFGLPAHSRGGGNAGHGETNFSAASFANQSTGLTSTDASGFNYGITGGNYHGDISINCSHVSTKDSGWSLY